MQDNINEEYYIFAGNNKYSKNRYTEEQAKAVFASLNNCENCTDCEHLTDCNNCENCEYCVDCIYCKKCVDCENCIGCVDCNNCQNCSNCFNCEECENCSNLKYCENCVNCSNDSCLKKQNNKHNKEKPSINKIVQEENELVK